MSGDPAAVVQVPPNLRQRLPTNVQVTQDPTTEEWRLGFASEVANDGPGYLKITGNGPGDETMVADQIVEMSDGSATTIPAVGQMRYVRGNHNHFHFLDFERYELRSVDDPSTTIVRDQKTGFCLANAFTTDVCGRDKPTLTTVSEGISSGGSDKYFGYLEGQYLVVDPVTTPDGDYLLVNRVNPTGALLDEATSDDAASLRLHLSWASSGQPTVVITNKCTNAIYCPPPPEPDPPPGPQPEPPAQSQGDPAPIGAEPPAQAPQPVPIVSPAEFATAPARVTMSRSMAGRLVRRAIQKSTKSSPRRLRTSCKRQGRPGFICTSTWRVADGVRWNGRIRVWYRDRAGQLLWFYDIAAQPSAGKRVVKRSVQGSASSALFSRSGGLLYCEQVD
jgi:hypothetical protein